MVSVLILTKDEEANLPGCLESVSWCDDIHVFDSFSMDKTRQIAEAAGARITEREFDDWSTHQNWALKNIAFKHSWVLYLDADERATNDLWEAAERAIADSTAKVAYDVERRDFFMGRWIKRSQMRRRFVRLFKPQNIRYERLVNPVDIVDGEVGHLSAFIKHYPFSHGLSHWISRHNRYSSFEAREIQTKPLPGFLRLLRLIALSRDGLARRRHMKELFYRLPFRPLVKFVLLYFVRGGFLDGYAGLTYAALQSIYEYMIVLKVRELKGTF